MIDDKMAKMAVNTLIAYCDGKRCADCAVSKTCDRSNGKPRYFASYPLVGLFGNLQKSTKKPPKFDIALKDSTDFREYINEIFMREAEKYGLPMSMNNSIKWYPSGKIKVTFVDDDATYVGVAKCHPDDAFNPEIGVRLAIKRAAQVMHAPFVPAEGEAYYYVDDEDLIYSTINRNTNKDALNIAIGNCFEKYKHAQDNADVIIKRVERATKLLKKLRDEEDE